jgi:diguanylate cyclase (GGDEF)-like protein/PAS domain S-box-containing protein
MEKSFDVHNQAEWEPSPVFLKYALATLFVGALCFIGVIYVMTPDQTGRYLGPAMGAAIAVLARGLLAAGNPLASVKLLAFGTWVLATVIAISQAGVRTPVVFAYPVIILLIGWLFSARAAVTAGALTVAVIVGLVAVEVAGLRLAPPVTPAAMYGVVEVLLVVLSVFMINFLIRSYKTRLAEVKHAAFDLAQRTQEAEDAQRNLDIAIKSTQMVFWQYDVVKDWLSYDDADLSWLGLNPATAPHTLNDWAVRLHPDDKGAFFGAFSRALQEESAVFDLDYRLSDGLGGWVWLHTRGTVARRDAFGKPLMAGGGSLNITDRKTAQERVLRSESLLRGMLDAVDEGILMVAPDGKILSLNRRFRELWQVPPALVESGQDDLLLKHVLDQLVDPDRFLSEIKRLYASTDVARDTLFFKDARVFARFTQTVEVDGVLGRIWCFRDISEATHLTSSLADSKKLLKAVIDTVPMRVFWKDQSLRYMGCNPAFAQDAGLSVPEDLLGKQDTDLGWRDQAALYAADDLRVMNSGVPKYSYDEPQTTPDGKAIWLRTSKVPLRNDANETIGVLGIYEDITERKHAEIALVESETRANALANMLRLMCDNVPDLIWAKDLNNRFIFTNKAMCDVLLSAADTDEPVGKDDMFFALRERQMHPDNPNWHTFGELCVNSDAVTLQNARASQFDEFGNVRGEFLFLDVRKAPFINALGEVIGVVGSGRDVTAQKVVEDRLQQMALVLENSGEGLMISDADNCIVDVNPAFIRMTGFAREDVIGKTPSMLKSGRQGADYYRDMWESLEKSGKWQGEIWNRRKDGHLIAEWLTINTLYAKDGTVHRRVALFSDITEKKKADEQIWTYANFDTLTHLPNRRMYQDRMLQEMKKVQRSGKKLALLFLDLDHFKEVNDSFGHKMGDMLLVDVAKRIVGCVRDTDTVARMGGDEFTVILTEVDELGSVERVANSIVHALGLPFEIGSGQSHVSASVGIAMYPTDATDSHELLRMADLAMYEAKDSGRNTYRYFKHPKNDTNSDAH